MVGVGAADFLQAPGPAQVLADKPPLTYEAFYKVPQGGSIWLRGLEPEESPIP